MAIDPENVDLETVNLLPTYRTGFLPPKGGSLTAGEIYVEVPVDGAAPRMWIGGLDGDIEPTIPGAPLNLTVPHLYQEGDILTCTMGNWSGKPTAYSLSVAGRRHAHRHRRGHLPGHRRGCRDHRDLHRHGDQRSRHDRSTAIQQRACRFPCN